MKRVSFTVSTETYEKLWEIADANRTSINRVAAAFVNGAMEQLAALGRIPTESGDIDELGNVNGPPSSDKAFREITQSPGYQSETLNRQSAIEADNNQYLRDTGYWNPTDYPPTEE